jgi:hypothetical protein
MDLASYMYSELNLQETKHRIYYINVKSPNLDLKQGISSLERERGSEERESESEREREREIEGRDGEIET